VAQLRIGLTGGIGSGKSTVAAMLSHLGASVIDSDAIARRLTAPSGAAIPAIRDAFGDRVLRDDGSLDRDAMRMLVFSNPDAKAALESILHPLIAAETAREASALGGDVQVFDVPLLTESRHWRQRVHRILVVDCDVATQVKRVAMRPGWTPQTAERVIASQASRAARRAIADAVIVNRDIDLLMLRDAVEKVWQLWRPIAPTPVEQ
jgi:dephospho-CoA kinase